MLDYLLETSGLTANQVARCFNTSPRTLYSWIANGIPARYEALVNNVYTMVSRLPVDTPEARRRLLLDSSQGKSLYYELCDQAPRNQRIQYPLPVTQLLGIEPPDN